MDNPMDKIELDALDNEIIRLLTENGRMPTGELAKKLNIAAPTVRYRIKNLEENGLFKVSGLIDPGKHREMIIAMVAMSVQSGGKLDHILEKISALPNVVWAGVVTGRYDIMAEVVCVGGKEELYRFTTETVLSIGNVVRSETFLFMKSRNNWLRLPEGVKKI
jgi:Lrp/AsnC family transcriptional regulator, regulator for asnA, asnC and gidA